MPEAAEVSVASAQLAHVAVGRELRSLVVTHPRTMRAAVPGSFERLAGRTVTRVRRHGKWLLLEVEGGIVLGVHLRMSGQLLARDPGDEPGDRHVHAVIELGDRAEDATAELGGVPAPLVDAPGTGTGPVSIWFRDPRTFGELRLLADGAPVAVDLFDSSVDADSLSASARRRRVGVKAVLLDQARTVSGIGSYLADEALHRAGISPLRPADSLAPTAWGRVLDGARSITRASAAVGGVTLPDEGWIDLWGRPGRYAPHLLVHGREWCGTCGHATRRATVGGRSARWCPRCQDARRRR